jgi:drug/metabolite transporter (DMT)-like permease
MCKAVSISSPNPDFSYKYNPLINNKILIGLAGALIAVLSWGGMFPIAKVILQSMDAFYMTLIRYVITATIFLLLLLALEGKQTLKYEGKFIPALIYGSFGFAGFSLLAFEGLRRSAPAHASTIAALQPMMMVFFVWATKGVRPAKFTLVCVMVALLGVILVITKGDVLHAFSGGSLLGDALVFLGALSWVVYTLAAARFPGWSAVRFTALTCAPAMLTVGLITAFATAIGYIHAPDWPTLVHIKWEMIYMVVFASTLAVIGWNVAVKNLGPLNVVLFGNLIPVIVLMIGLWQGQRFQPIEFIGVGIVIAALVANNLYARRQLRPALSPST